VFEPTDAELQDSGTAADDSDDDMIDVADVFNVKGKGKKARAKPVVRSKRAALQILDSDDINLDDDDEMSDFIVQSDEDEEEKDVRRSLKNRLGKRRAIVIESEDEIEVTPQEREVIFGAKKRQGLVSGEQIKLMPRFLPSTKMKHMMECLHTWAKEHPDEKMLIVSQWTGCLSLVSDYLTEQGVLHVKYQGDMNRVKRDQAVRASAKSHALFSALEALLKVEKE